MNIETACTVLGIHVVTNRSEMIKLAHAAFRRAAAHVHPDRVAYQPAVDSKSAEEHYALLAEALTVVKKTFEVAPPRTRTDHQPVRSVITERPVCVINLRLTPEDMVSCTEPRFFKLAYEDACNHCVRTGKYRMEGSRCFDCNGYGKLQGIGTLPGTPETICQSCLGTGNQFCELPCPRCKGKQGIRFDVCVEVSAGVALPIGACVHEIEVTKDSFYSKIIVRVVPKLPEPSADGSLRPSSTPETI